jgi:hypothetical protein
MAIKKIKIELDYVNQILSQFAIELKIYSKCSLPATLLPPFKNSENTTPSLDASHCFPTCYFLESSLTITPH